MAPDRFGRNMEHAGYFFGVRPICNQYENLQLASRQDSHRPIVYGRRPGYHSASFPACRECETVARGWVRPSSREWRRPVSIQGSINPFLIAYRTTALMSLASSFSIIWDLWHSTVFRDTFNALAISLQLEPAASNATTSRSRAVRQF